MDEITAGKVGVRSLSSQRRGHERPRKRNGIASRRGARIVGKKAVQPHSGPNRAFRQKEGCQERKGVVRMPLFIAPQLCASVERPPSGNDWIHEIAFDGYRIQMRVEDGNVTLKTRNGLDWTPKFGAIATAAGALPDCIVDGEIVALDHQGSPDLAGLQASLSDGKTDELIFFAFDVLFLGGQDLRQQSLMDRKQALKGLIEKSFGKDQAEVRYVEHFESGGEAVLKSASRMSLEGIVSKRAAARYASGRTSAWTKDHPANGVLPAKSEDEIQRDQLGPRAVPGRKNDAAAG
jgi:bifunctional non-homologous end joining protein LigD